MSWPSSLPHTANSAISDSHRLQERVGSCLEPPGSSTRPDLPPPQSSSHKLFRDLFSLFGQSPSTSPSLQDGSLPSDSRIWACLSLREKQAFLFHSLLQLPYRPAFLKKRTWLCCLGCNLFPPAFSILWEQLLKVIL